MSDHYILEADHSTRAVGFEEYMASLKDKSEFTHRVAYDELGDVRISTVFLGLDHNWNPESTEPLIFETMVFPKDSFRDLDMWRYSTWDEAKLGHDAAVAVYRTAIENGGIEKEDDDDELDATVH